MKTSKLILAVVAGSAALAAAPAFADRDRFEHDRGWHHGWERHHRHFAPRVVVVPAPAPRVFYPSGVYYTPPPVVYQSAPVYPPAPVYYSVPAPVYAPQPGVSIRFNVPL